MSINLAELPQSSIDFYSERSIPGIQLSPQPNPLSLILYLPVSLARDNVELFIKQQFRLKHGALIKHYMPYLLSLENSDNQVLAAAGFRPACKDELFLEQYLDKSVEHYLQLKLGEKIQRSSIIEVGNLASDSPGSSRLMIMAMTCLFDQQGFEWVVMTGTNELINIFKNLSLKPVPLAHARASCLKEEQFNWGSYYTHNPRVLAGNIKNGHKKLLQSNHYRQFINSLCACNLPPCTK